MVTSYKANTRLGPWSLVVLLFVCGLTEWYKNRSIGVMAFPLDIPLPAEPVFMQEIDAVPLDPLFGELTRRALDPHHRDVAEDEDAAASVLSPPPPPPHFEDMFQHLLLDDRSHAMETITYALDWLTSVSSAHWTRLSPPPPPAPAPAAAAASATTNGATGTSAQQTPSTAAPTDTTPSSSSSTSSSSSSTSSSSSRSRSSSSGSVGGSKNSGGDLSGTYQLVKLDTFSSHDVTHVDDVVVYQERDILVRHPVTGYVLGVQRRLVPVHHKELVILDTITTFSALVSIRSTASSSLPSSPSTASTPTTSPSTTTSSASPPPPPPPPPQPQQQQQEISRLLRIHVTVARDSDGHHAVTAFTASPHPNAAAGSWTHQNNINSVSGISTNVNVNVNVNNNNNNNNDATAVTDDSNKDKSKKSIKNDTFVILNSNLWNYNLWEARLPLLEREILSSSPDVLLLQEVRAKKRSPSPNHRFQVQDVVLLVSKALRRSVNWVYEPAMSFIEGREHHDEVGTS